jgi:ATP synthase protein I
MEDKGPLISMNNDIKKTIRNLGYLSTVGMTMAICIFLGAFIGHYLDKKLNTDPWLLLVFIVFGIIAAYKNLITMVRKSRKDDQKSE